MVEQALSKGDEGSLAASLLATLERGALGKLLYDVEQVEMRNKLSYCVKEEDQELGENFNGSDVSANKQKEMSQTQQEEAEVNKALMQYPEPMRVCAVPMVGLL